MKRLFTFLLAFAIALAAAVPPFDEISAAIRQNDLVELHSLVQSSQAANIADRLQSTPLHYAALYGSVEALRMLLDAGADSNARNQAGVTPLVYAAWSFERARLLVEHGAAVNVATKEGITPLLVAAAAQGNAATVRYLLAKGADVTATAKGGEDALMRATAYGDVEMVKLLLGHGADAKRADEDGSTALQSGTISPDARRVKLLLEAGSDVNASAHFAGMVKNGPIALTKLTTLMTAAPYSDQETIEWLLKSGARVNEMDIRGMTPLMLSIATDHAQPATVRRLIAAGADVRAKDKNGDSALDWARRYQNPEILSLLLAAGAPEHEVAASPVTPAQTKATSPGDSIGRTLTLFGKSDFLRAGGGCSGCHHQPAHARASMAAQQANLAADTGLRQAFLDSQTAIRPRLVPRLRVLSSFGGDIDTALAYMITYSDLNEKASEWTDMLVHFIAARQDPSGAWINYGVARAPISDSAITRTAQSIVVIEHYGWPARKSEFDAKVRLAERWLQRATPETTYEHADRILGLHAAGMSKLELRADAERLLSLQREDGGWSQTRFLQSDAYATGMVLEVLCRTGLVNESDAAYRRGAAFLLRTQFPDGSWYVRSRAPKFQPYFQSGLPFDHDQWISSVGSAWGVMALSHAAKVSMAATVH